MSALKTFFTIIAVSIILGSTALQAEVLDSLIDIALERNPEIQAAISDVSAADYSAKASGALPDPQLSLAFQNLPKSSLALNETPMTGIVLGLTQSIPWPGKLSARSNLADQHTRTQSAKLDVVRSQIIRKVERAYYDYSHRSAVLSKLEEYVGLMNSLIEVVRVRYENGESSAQDLLRAQTTLARLEARMLKVRQDRESALLNLARLLDSDRLSTTHIRPGLPEVESYSYQDQIDLTRSPKVRTAQSSRSTAERRVALEKSDYYPDLTVGIDYRYREEVPMDPVMGEDFLSFRLGVRIPLWFFKSHRNSTRSAQETLTAVQNLHRSVELNVREQFDSAILEINRTLQTLELYDSDVLPQAKAAFEAAKIAYEVGEVDFNALLSAHLELLEIEIERTEILRMFHDTQAVINELKGQS